MGYGNQTLLELIGEAEAVIRTRTGMAVYDGPFAGMKLVEATSWGVGDLSPKLLGTYEREVQETIAAFARRTRYDAVVDIGCAEGFFAVGTARLMQGTPVFGYDINPKALHIMQIAAEANGVAAQVQGRGACAPADLVRIAASHPRLLVISDCEGYEMTLFTDRAVLHALTRSDLVIECHDFADSTITGTLLANLQFTHVVEILRGGARDPNGFPFLAHVHDGIRWAAIQESRPSAMHWLVCRSRTP